jgi:hypothetical protein
MPEPSWTDRVTAVATAVTAFFAAIAAVATVVALYREAKRSLPVIELTTAELGALLKLHLKITNRLDETLVIDKISVTKPRDARLSQGKRPPPPTYSNTREPEVGETNFVLSPAIVYETGSISTMMGLPERIDRSVLDLYFSPPENWRGGSLRLDIFVSSRADTIRNKRIVVKKEVKLASAQKSDANINKAD